MKITKECLNLITFFLKNNCLLPLKQIKKTDTILTKLYNKLTNGFKYIEELKSTSGEQFYKLKVENITNINQIPKPTLFSQKAFPSKIRKHIDDFSLGLLSYNFNLFGRKINILFVIENDEVEKLKKMYNNYVDYMLVWLYIVNIYSSKKCVKQLKIIIYHTTLLKILPTSNVSILDENNINTAFTTTCPSDSEIVVYRKEELFKVFIHETFHNFGLDFSDMNMIKVNEKILNLFQVNSNVNLFESYTEFWARIINIVFVSFTNMNNKNNINEFLINTEFFINYERIFAFFQMVKILNFMGLNYHNLYKKDNFSYNLKKTLYKENSNVLSYYIITLILIDNYQDFLLWCNINNTELLQFKNTKKNLEKYCNFIETNYKSKSIINGVDCTKKILSITKLVSKKNKELNYVLNNLRMTVCELG
jgi:nucleoside diphosphate kinase